MNHEFRPEGASLSGIPEWLGFNHPEDSVLPCVPRYFEWLVLPSSVWLDPVPSCRALQTHLSVLPLLEYDWLAVRQ